ncbi:MAG: antibiotic biosynthesis monooxygenase [Planctomycetaceae bacterium]|nr:antibiotic biosynthesis monooxygenase [Planctomycetaceae bacterium]
MIHVIATVQCRPGCRADFLAEFHQIVPEVLAEDGCLEYGPTVDLTTDVDNQHCDEHRVTIIEKWESLEHLKAHLVAPHMLAYRPKVADYVDGAQLRILENG